MTKHDWILEALREKLDSCEKKRFYVFRDYQLHVKLTAKDTQRLERQVEFLNKTRICTYSKKLFIIEAIFEKLAKESSKVQKLLEETQELCKK